MTSARCTYTSRSVQVYGTDLLQKNYKYLKMFKLSSAILTLWFVGAAHLDRRWKSAAKWPSLASARVRQPNGVSYEFASIHASYKLYIHPYIHKTS